MTMKQVVGPLFLFLSVLGCCANQETMQSSTGKAITMEEEQEQGICVLPKERSLCDKRFYESCYEAVCFGSDALCDNLSSEEVWFFGLCVASEALAKITNCDCFGCEGGVSGRPGAVHCYGGAGIDVTQPVRGGCEAGHLCQPEIPLCELQEHFVFATLDYGVQVDEDTSSLDYYGPASDCDFYDDGRSNDAIVCANAGITQDDQDRNYCDITFAGTNDGLDILRYVFSFLALEERSITFGSGENEISFTALEQLADIAFGPDEHSGVDGIVEIAYEAARSKGCFTRPRAAVHLSGHSLASALSNFFVLKLAAEFPDVYVKMTTIGEPSVLTRPLEGRAATLQAWGNKHKYLSTRVMPRGDVFHNFGNLEREYRLRQDHDWVAQVLPGAFTAENNETQHSFLCEVKNGNFLQYFIAGPYGPGGPDEQDAPYGCAEEARVETLDDMPFFPHRSGLEIGEDRHPISEFIDDLTELLDEAGFDGFASFLEFINLASTLGDADFRDDFYQIFDIHFMRRPLHLLNLLYENSASCDATLRQVELPSEPMDPDNSDSWCWICCFAGTDKVDVKDKGVTLMKDLAIGDKVMTSTGKYDTVYSFGHLAPDSRAEFLEIHIDYINGEEPEPLLISKKHMVFVDEKITVPASKLVEGSNVLLADGSLAEVKSINTAVRRGVYAPFTSSGTIVVNGVVASSFVDLQDKTGFLHIGDFQTPFSWHWLSFVFEAPHRLVCMQSWVHCAKETYTEEGISSWAATPLRWSEWLFEQNGVVATIILLLIFSVALGCLAIESVFLYPVLTLLAVVAVLYVAYRCSSSERKKTKSA